VTCIPIARQRVGKHIPEETYARNNRTSIAIQRIIKQAFSTIERLFFRVVRAEGLYMDKESRLSCCRELDRVLEMALEAD
jgi:hypothetical protein